MPQIFGAILITRPSFNEVNCCVSVHEDDESEADSSDASRR